MNFKQTTSPGIKLCYVLIVFAVLSRLVPHPYNFTPVGALGLFAGSYLPLRRFWLVPVIALLVSDVFLGFYHPIAMISVYMSFVLCGVIGRSVLMQKRSIIRLAVTSLSASCLFFIVSNFGDWLSQINHYPMTFNGLLQCYAMAIPFFGNTIAGDLFYVAVLFGVYEAVNYRIHQLHNAKTA